MEVVQCRPPFTVKAAVPLERLRQPILSFESIEAAQEYLKLLHRRSC